MTSTSAVTSGSWGAVLAPTTVTSEPSCPSSPYCASYTFTLVSSTTPSYVNAWNTGTLTLTGLSYYGTWSGSTTLVLSACSVAWSQGSGTCSGTTTTVYNGLSSGSYAAVTTARTFPASAGSEIYLQVSYGTGKPPSNTSITMSLYICSGGTSCSDGTTTRQIRAATTTNA